jgi:FAD/FMN-containing dehydrogenase
VTTASQVQQHGSESAISPTVLDKASLEGFAEGFRGALIQPGDGGYESARRVFNGMIDRRPALIARCTGVADVIAAVNFARENELLVAVRGGGHSVPGYGTCDSGIVIDLSSMRDIRVDPVARTARAQGGVTWGEFDRETQIFGLAVTGGRVSTTGIAGLTLGSGSGWLERRLGYTCDNLLSADVVLADGRFVTASESENADLFWGLRGGGGNFGVVTEFELRVHDVGPIVLGGMLLWPRERAAEVLHVWRALMEEAPDELGTGFAFITAPPEPFVPEHLRGQPAVGILVCYAGDVAAGQEAIGPLRQLGPDLDLVQPMPYTVVQTLIDAPNQPGFQNYWKAEFLPELSNDAVDVLVERAALIRSPLTQLYIEPLGGAVARVGGDDTALGNRSARYAFHCETMWADPAEADTHIAWARGFAEAMQPFAVPGVYLNFTSDQEQEERVRSSYGPKYERLAELKRRYDQDNFFSLNPNIRPA